MFLILQFLVSCVFSFTSQPPCCRDHLGTPACTRMLNQNLRMFSRRCNNDAEFRIIQCCSTCNIDGVGMAYDLVARSLVSEQCFDRYGPQFCDRYVNKTDVFEPHNTWSCDGENPQIAFRACRKSCGYCNFNHVNYTLQNAIQACNPKITSKSGKRWESQFRLKNNTVDKESASPIPTDIINSTFRFH